MEEYDIIKKWRFTNRDGETYEMAEVVDKGCSDIDGKPRRGTHTVTLRFLGYNHGNTEPVYMAQNKYRASLKKAMK